MKETVIYPLYLEADLHKRFRIHCITLGLTMRKRIVELIKKDLGITNGNAVKREVGVNGKAGARD